MKHKISQKHSFTLIELLVVIAIIAILAGILMPALSSARERSRTSSCAGNLKALAFAMQQYADNNNGRAKSCSANDRDNKTRWSSFYMLGPSWQDIHRMTLVPYLGGPGYADRDTAVVNDVVKQAVCPSGRRDGTDSLTTKEDSYKNDGEMPNGSYTFSTYVTFVDSTTVSKGTWEDRRYQIFSKIWQPSSRGMVMDSTLKHNELSSTPFSTATAGNSRVYGIYRFENIATRHNSGANAAFCDGHVEFLQSEKIRIIGSGSSQFGASNGYSNFWHNAR